MSWHINLIGQVWINKDKNKLKLYVKKNLERFTESNMDYSEYFKSKLQKLLQIK